MKMAQKANPREECAHGWLLPNARWAGISKDCEGQIRRGDDVIEWGDVELEFQRWGEVGGVRVRNRRPSKKYLNIKEPNGKLVEIRRPFREKRRHYWPQKNRIVWKKISNGATIREIQPM